MQSPSCLALPDIDCGYVDALTQSPDFQTTFPTIHGPENATLLGAVLSFFVLGAFFGCVANILLGNRFGRRSTLIVGAAGTLIGGARRFTIPLTWTWS